jgi:hypothetical protein
MDFIYDLYFYWDKRDRDWDSSTHEGDAEQHARCCCCCWRLQLDATCCTNGEDSELDGNVRCSEHAILYGEMGILTALVCL